MQNLPQILPRLIGAFALSLAKEPSAKLFRVYTAFTQQYLDWLQQPHDPERDSPFLEDGWTYGQIDIVC